MNKKYFWYLVPFFTMWACFYVSSIVIDGKLFDNWYNVPTIISLVVMFSLSFVFAADKEIYSKR